MNDAIFKDCPIPEEASHISKQAYYRYIITKLKPELDKCFYFDCDIVITASLGEFWNTDLGDYYVAAVKDMHKLSDDYAKKYGLEKYFNSGVLLINLKKWKEDNITETLFKNTVYLAVKNLIMWVDQDVLNYTFKGNVKWLSPRYNLQINPCADLNSKYYTDFENQKTVIIHFCSDLKPWQLDYKHKLGKVYHKYWKISPFKKAYYKYVLKSSIKKLCELVWNKEISFDYTVKRLKIFGINVYERRLVNGKKIKYLFGIMIKTSNYDKK